MRYCINHAVQCGSKSVDETLLYDHSNDDDDDDDDTLLMCQLRI